MNNLFVAQRLHTALNVVRLKSGSLTDQLRGDRYIGHCIKIIERFQYFFVGKQRENLPDGFFALKIR